MNSALFTTLKTKEEAQVLLKHLRTLDSSLFNAKLNVEEKINETIPYTQKGPLLAMAQQQQVNIKDVAAVQKFIEDLKKQIDQLPTLSLTLAFEPKEATLQNISNWITLNLRKHMLLDITVDKNIIAGTIIVQNGIYKDYSVKKKLKEKFTIAH